MFIFSIAPAMVHWQNVSLFLHTIRIWLSIAIGLRTFCRNTHFISSLRLSRTFTNNKMMRCFQIKTEIDQRQKKKKKCESSTEVLQWKEAKYLSNLFIFSIEFRSWAIIHYFTDLLRKLYRMELYIWYDDGNKLNLVCVTHTPFNFVRLCSSIQRV